MLDSLQRGKLNAKFGKLQNNIQILLYMYDSMYSSYFIET